MLYVSSNVVKLTRGDTARLAISITNDSTGEAYEIQETDILTLTVKSKATDSTICFQKVIQGSNVFHIEPEDTAALSFTSYLYDVQINQENGDVYTIIEPTKFTILQEVTW